MDMVEAFTVNSCHVTGTGVANQLMAIVKTLLTARHERPILFVLLGTGCSAFIIF
jgi:hypothetical protein